MPITISKPHHSPAGSLVLIHTIAKKYWGFSKWSPEKWDPDSISKYRLWVPSDSFAGLLEGGKNKVLITIKETPFGRGRAMPE